MRDSCLTCTRKHLAQALILESEMKRGYPNYLWLVVGHLAEAEEETLRDYPEFCSEIREHRLIFIESNGHYDLPIMKIISQITEREVADGTHAK